MFNLHGSNAVRPLVRPSFFSASLCLCGLILLFLSTVVAQPPSPKSVFGFTPSDDKTIADWNQIVDYFSKLDRASDKVLVREIGKSTLGKPLIVAFISSAGNIKNLDKYRQISAKLADPRTIKDAAELDTLIKNGKTIVSISCSIHSTEIVASQMSMNLAYELATATDADTKEILDNTILLLIPSPNPDGVQIVADWYKKTLGTRSEGTSPPELYHHYAGHDNNRDWFMLNLKETQAVTKLFWQDWYPQLVYDVHQQGVNASRFTIPPFFDPPNPRVSPTILREVGLIGYKMAADLQAKGVEGVATNSTYDTWWHGGFRSAPYYHNSIGILSEAASANLMSPVTVRREDLARTRNTRGLPNLLETATNYPDTWEGGLWRPADINNIEMIASRALLQMGAKFRQRYLRNFYEFGKTNLQPDPNVPQAYVVIAGQPNAEVVSRFLEIVTWQGIEVQQMTHELWVKHSKTEDFHEIPLGSFLIFTNQPQKNNVLSLFEKQVYPHRLLPNGDAEAPYDVAGWTLPLQMGVETYEIWDIRDLAKFQNTIKPVTNINEVRTVMNLKPNSEPFAKLPNPLRSSPRIGLYKPFASSMDEGWTRLVLDNHQITFKSLNNDDFRLNRLDVDTIILAADSENTIKPVTSINEVRTVMNLKPNSEPFAKLPNPLRSSPRIGLYKPFASSMDEGWTRLVLDNHQITFKSLNNDDFRLNRLDVDTIILAADSENTIMNGLSAERYPAEFAGGIGEAGAENLKKFVENGGRLVCFDDSCGFVIKRFGLPIKNVVSGVRRNEFYNPGSIVKLQVDTKHPLSRGLLEETPAYFSTSSAFEIADGANVTTIARYTDKDALMSGWMLGEKFINGRTALAEAIYGKGKIVLFAFRPQHRGQTYATFPFIFNALAN